MLVRIANREDPDHTSWGGSRISGKGVHIYKNEGGLALPISSHFPKYPMKMK